MDSEIRPSKGMYWAGWIIGILPSLFMLGVSALPKFFPPAGMEANVEPLGWKMSQMTTLGILEASVVILYLIPQTSVIGAILCVAYLGGAAATHVRIDDAWWFMPVILGVMFWLGLWLRDPRLRSILPITR
jgi:hypothetical protein